MPEIPPSLPPSPDNLDAEELLHLALRASEADDTAGALSFLKQALLQQPADARLHYLMGIQHAHLGMYDRAVREIEHAVQLDATLHTAHFQLGLLHMTSGRMTEASRAWQPLGELAENDALRLFKSALEHLALDEFDLFYESIRRGIQANVANAALNGDMERLMQQVKSARDVAASTSTSSAGEPTPHPASPSGRHVLLNAYRKE